MEKVKDIDLESEEATREFAAGFAQGAQAGQNILLVGELGAGKTTFAQGFAAALGVCEPLTSPTFAICNEYQTASHKLLHFDLYRLEHPEELEEIGFPESLDSSAICLIEWPEIALDFFRDSLLVVQLEHHENGRCARWLSCGPGELEQLVSH